MLQTDSAERLYSLREAIAQVRATTGIPVTASRFHKDSASGQAPRPDAVYGNTFLYTLPKVMDWARSRLKPEAAPEQQDTWQQLGDVAAKVVAKVAKRVKR